MFGLQNSTRCHSYKENKSVVPLTAALLQYLAAKDLVNQTHHKSLPEDPSVEASRLACSYSPGPSPSEVDRNWPT